MAKELPGHLLELTASEAAIFTGVKWRQFMNYKNDEDPPPETDDKTFRSDEFGEWLRRRAVRKAINPNGKGGKSGDGFLDPAQERARKDKELADKTAMENAVRRGELVEASQVQAGWFDILTRVRARMLRIPAATAPLVLGEEDRVVIQKVLEDAIRDALSEMSVDWRPE